MSARKVRNDSVLDGMPLHQQDALITWLIEERLDEEEALDRLWQDFSVKSSKTALGNFWHRHCAPRLLRRSADAAEAFGENAGGLTTNWSEPSKALIRQKFFELSASRSVNPKDLLAFAQMVAAMDQGELEREKLKFNRTKTALSARLTRQRLRQDLDKFRHRVKTDLEKALDAFAAEVGHNPAAQAAFDKLKSAVGAAVKP